MRRVTYSIPSLRKVIRETTGEVISRSYCHKILKSRFYIGLFSGRGTEYQGKHPALVSHGTFQQVQDVLSGRNVNKCKPHKHGFPFSGLMVCVYCGCTITAERHKGKYDYYRCSFGRGRHEFTYMTGKYVSDTLANVVKGIRIPEQVVQQIVESIRRHYAGTQEKRQEQVGKLNQRLSSLRTRMHKSYQDKLECKIDEEFWSVNMNDWREEERQVQAALEAISQPQVDDPALSAQKIIELAQNAHSIYLAGNDAERGELLKTVLLNCETDGVNISPTYKKPFEIIFQRGQNEEWRREWDSNPS